MDDCEQTSSIVEDGMGDVSVKKRHRKHFLYSQILKQMEFYFSDANLCRDRFMSQYLAKSDGIPIEVFLNFNKIRELNCDIKDIAKALRSSEIINVSEDGKSLTRKTKVKQKKNQDDCIIYVEQLPPDANHEWVIGIFSAYGKVEYVSIPKFKNKPVIKGFAFVEFDTPEAAKRALEAFGSVGSCLPQQMQPEELCSIATFEEDKGEEQGAAESQHQDDDRERAKRKAEKSEHDSHLDESSTVLESEDNSEPKSKKVKIEDSSEGKEKRKSKKSETSTISQGASENIAENEVKEEVEDEKSSFASKKGKKRKITEMEEEKNEGGELNADNESQNKKKKKHSFVEETESVHTEYVCEDSKQGDSPEKKKKKKKQHREDEECANECEEGMELDHHQEVSDAVYSKKKKNKHKPDDGDVHENEEGTELDDNQEVFDAQQSKKKKKRKSVEKDNDIEDVDDDEGTAPKEKTDDNEEEAENDGREETDEHMGEASVKKKRSRKRNKDKKKNKKGGDPTFGLRIISKNEWRRLRNKYLNLQREKMVALKKHLARRQYGSVHQSPFSSQDNYRQNVRVDPQNPKPGGQVKQEKISFTPGVIMKINLSSPLMDVTSFKTSAKLCEDVAYVDANEGDTKVYLRCSSSDGVQKLLSERKWENVNVLEGDEEKKYWEKIFEDRTSKFQNKVKVKVRGKDKLMKRAERELGKHIKFDD